MAEKFKCGKERRIAALGLAGVALVGTIALSGCRDGTSNQEANHQHSAHHLKHNGMAAEAPSVADFRTFNRFNAADHSVQTVVETRPFASHEQWETMPEPDSVYTSHCSDSGNLKVELPTNRDGFTYDFTLKQAPKALERDLVYPDIAEEVCGDNKITSQEEADRVGHYIAFATNMPYLN